MQDIKIRKELRQGLRISKGNRCISDKGITIDLFIKSEKEANKIQENIKVCL